MSKTRVGIINVTGYAGVELARLLCQHPEVELTSVTGRSAAGQELGVVFPHLAGLEMTVEGQLARRRRIAPGIIESNLQGGELASAVPLARARHDLL